MAPMILIKFCGFIVPLKPNYMILLAFSRKIPEIGKIVFNFCPPPNVAPKPIDQSHSNSVSGVRLKISPALFFFFSSYSQN